MQLISGLCTDAGTVKKINQDSLCIKSANFRDTSFTMGVICDGLGGLSDGETASSYIVNGLSVWFENTLPGLLKGKISMLDIRHQLDSELHRLNRNLNRYCELTGKNPASTMTALLFISSAGKVITAHIGDTRIYRIYEDKTIITTEDHSVLAEEIRKGNITKEEALYDSRQNQLTKCMGAGLENISFDYKILPEEDACTYLICSDGFRKTILEEEISSALKPSALTDNTSSEQILRNLTDLCMQRGETDNISSLILKIKRKD